MFFKDLIFKTEEVLLPLLHFRILITYFHIFALLKSV